ncbi:MAG: hypothetical protein ACYC6R_09915 [Anaerolineales bacterium]
MVSLSQFVEKVQAEMRRQGKIPADIARAGLVTDAALSKLLNLQQKTVGFKMMNAIAAALDLPLNVVQEWAGYKPQRRADRDELDERIDHLASRLKYKASKESAIEFLEFLKLQEERGAYNIPENQKTPSSEIGQ